MRLALQCVSKRHFGSHQSSLLRPKPGCLYIVATPLGNIADLSERQRTVLSEATTIAVEDSRQTGLLFASAGIKRSSSFIQLHDHNEKQNAKKLLDLAKAGSSVCLVSDAGTPTISDPGYALVRAAHDAGITVSPVPGPCAAIAALSASGAPTDRFVFEGFAPRTASQRLTLFREMVRERRTLVFYEAPHRLIACLQDMVQVFGAERYCSVAKELTKDHEHIESGPLQAVLDYLSADSTDDVPDARRRGEFVICLAGYRAPAGDEAECPDDALRILEVLCKEGIAASKAASIAASLTGLVCKYNPIEQCVIDAGHKKSALYDHAVRVARDVRDNDDDDIDIQRLSASRPPARSRRT